MKTVMVAVAAGMVAAAAVASVLDVEALEREVRRDIAVFGVATGEEEAVPAPEMLADMPPGQVRELANALCLADREAALALYGELARRELSWEDRIGVLQDLLWWQEREPEHREMLREAIMAWGMPLWEAWKAGEVPEEEQEAALITLFPFCHKEWYAARGLGVGGATEAEDREESEEAKVWEERTDELWEALYELTEAQEKSSREKSIREAEASGERSGERGGADGGGNGAAGGEPVGAAEWHFRRGVEMSDLGRDRDAAAEWGEAERLAEESGDAALAQEVRATRAVYGDWRWRRAERRALCEAELAAGSPWRKQLLEVLAEEAEAAGNTTEATELALEGWWTYGGMARAGRVGDLVAKGGGEDLALWHRVCGERLEEIPAREERIEEILALVEFRWAMGKLFPERVEPSLEGDLARLRERVAEAADQAEEEEGEPEGEEVKEPGARWRGGESWRTDPSVPEIEREFNGILKTEGWRRKVDAWASWREKWSEEERRALVVDGVEAEFVSWADEFCNAPWYAWDEMEDIGLRALEEAKRQERYDAGRLWDVLKNPVLYAEVEGPADATAITDWTEWARRVAMGDAVNEDFMAILELIRAFRLEDEAAMRRLAGDERKVVSLCEWAYWPGEFEKPWMVLARWSGEGEAVRLAILHERLAGLSGHGMVVDVLMDAMSVEELESLREVRRLRALADAAAELDGKGERMLQWLARSLGNRRERNWWNQELHLRLARLEAQGADGGAEGQALAEALGPKSVRGTLARLRWRLAGGTDADETAEEAAAGPGRWREWCACAWQMADGMWPGDGESRGVGAYDGEGYHSGWIPPWMDRMLQGRLAEALELWGADTTEEEREAIADALEELGARAGEEMYGMWLQEAGYAGEWAVEALEAGRERRARGMEAMEEGEDGELIEIL